MSTDGMNYAPRGKPSPVVGKGEFVFAALALDHGHIYGQCNGLVEAGAELKWVYDPDPKKVEKFAQSFPGVRVARSEQEILDDPAVRLVAAAAVPSERGPLGCRVMKAGKDYFTDKCPFTTLEQLREAERVVQWTGRKYMVYYGERLHNEAAVHAGLLIEQGAIGRVVNMVGLGPHRLTAASRPAWFFQKARYGGILTDIASHQFEQFLHYTRARDGVVTHARVANVANPQYPELEDVGDATLVADNGATCYIRVDWLTPDGLRTWGDGRTFILGTKGYIELRKYIDVGRHAGGNLVVCVDDRAEQVINVSGQVGYPFFGKLVLDCIYRTEYAMTQAHAFKAAELALLAQLKAEEASYAAQGAAV